MPVHEPAIMAVLRRGGLQCERASAYVLQCCCNYPSVACLLRSHTTS